MITRSTGPSVLAITITILMVLSALPMLETYAEGDGGRDVSNTGTVWGYISDEQGNPLFGATIIFHDDSASGLDQSTNSKTGGYYTIDVAPNNWDVRVHKDGFFNTDSVIAVHRGDVIRHDFTLAKVPPMTSQIKGHVSNNDTGFSIIGAQIIIFDLVNNYTTSVFTNILGNYKVNIFQGNFLMQVVAPGFLPRFYGGIMIERDQILTIDIVLFPQPPIDARLIGDISYKLDDGKSGIIPFAKIVAYDASRSFLNEFEADASGHYDLDLYGGDFLFVIMDENSSFLDSDIQNVTTVPGNVVVNNFRLNELPPTQNLYEMNLTDWNSGTMTLNVTSWGRSDDGDGMSLKYLRFIIDVYLGNGDLYASAVEMDVFLHNYEKELRNSYNLYDTADKFTIDGIDLIFNEQFEYLEMDASGSIFSNGPQYIEFQMKVATNGTIDNNAPRHEVWMNMSLATNNEKEVFSFDYPDIFTMTNLTGSSLISVTEVGFGSIEVVPGLDPNFNDDIFDVENNWDLVDRIPPVAKAGPNITANEDALIELDASGSSDNFWVSYYQWDFGDGNQTNTTSPVTTHAYEEPGMYQVDLLVGDPIFREDNDSLWIEVLDITPPSIEIVFDPTQVKEDQEVVVGTNATDNVRIHNISWAIDGAHVSNGTELVHIFSQPGQYLVEATVTDTSGNTASDHVDITVTDETPPLADPGANRTVNESQEVIFDASGSSDNVDVVSYIWKFGDNSSNVTGKISTHEYNEPGNYTFSLTVKDAVGHIATSSGWILVKDITPPRAEFQSKKNAMVDEKVLFNANRSFDNVGIVEFLWDFGDGTNDTGMNITHKFRHKGPFEITLKVMDAAGQNDTFTSIVEVTEPDNPMAALLCIGSIIVGLPLAGIVVFIMVQRWRRGGYKIDEAFVIYKDGRLIRHVSTHPISNSDKDIVASMLTAVQEFVKDSLKKKEGDFLGKLEFGKKTKILIEKGDNVYLAVVLTGHDPEKLRGKLAKNVLSIEEHYKETLHDWDGDSHAFEGLDEQVIELIEN